MSALKCGICGFVVPGEDVISTALMEEHLKDAHNLWDHILRPNPRSESTE